MLLLHTRVWRAINALYEPTVTFGHDAIVFGSTITRGGRTQVSNERGGGGGGGGGKYPMHSIDIRDPCSSPYQIGVYS